MSLASVSPDRYYNQMKMSFGIESKVYEAESFAKPKKEITVEATTNDDMDLPHEDSEIKIIDNNQNLRPVTANIVRVVSPKLSRKIVIKQMNHRNKNVQQVMSAFNNPSTKY